MTTIAHKHYAGTGGVAAGPQAREIYQLHMRPSRAHSFSLPKHWVADRMTVLLLPAAIALVGVLGAILCSLVPWQ